MNVEPLIAEVERAVAEGHELPTILQTAVEKLHQAHPAFDWTGIYELTAAGNLRLGPFVGAPTEHVSIEAGQGVCGTAVAEQRTVNVPDVGELDNYLACSLETRSELVVLIRDAERIYGQIDIDSHRLAAFDQTTVRAVEQLAAALATAYAARLEPRR